MALMCWKDFFLLLRTVNTMGCNKVMFWVFYCHYCSRLVLEIRLDCTGWERRSPSFHIRGAGQESRPCHLLLASSAKLPWRKSCGKWRNTGRCIKISLRMMFLWNWATFIRWHTPFWPAFIGKVCSVAQSPRTLTDCPTPFFILNNVRIQYVVFV